MPARLLEIIVRNLFRSRTRLVITVFGCALGAFVTCFFLSAEKSLDRMTNAASKDANIVVRQKDRYWPTASRVPDAEVSQIRSLPQVVEAMPVRLMMTSCQSSTDVIAVHGVDKEQLLTFRRHTVDSGQLAAFKGDVSGALVGAKIARRYGWKPGQNVTLTELNGISFNVRGILEKRGSADDFLIYVGRTFLQQAENEQGTSHYVLVKTRPGVEPSTVCRAIDDLPLTIQTTSQPEEALLTTILDQLADLVQLSRGIVAVVIVVVLIAVGNAISMATRDRSQEFGIIRTLGFPKRAIGAMVLGEGVIQGIIGGLLGCLAVQVLVWLGMIQSVATCAITVEFLTGLPEWGMAVGVVAAAAALGSLLPAWTASRLDIVRALRPEE